MAALRVAGVRAPALGTAIRIDVEGRPVAVFNVGGTLFALDAKCTHVGGPLEAGPVRGTMVTCPWHGSEFDLTTGAVLKGPAVKPVKAYRVRVEADGLTLEPV